jgi:hypothetical protein
MKQDDTPCEGCGVVTNVRQMAGVASDSRQDKPYEVPILELSRAGPGEDVKMTDHIGSGKTLDELRQQPSGRWLVTVRYDNGAYAAFEQDRQPSVQKGDRVRVVDGKVELK